MSRRAQHQHPYRDRCQGRFDTRTWKRGVKVKGKQINQGVKAHPVSWAKKERRDTSHASKAKDKEQPATHTHGVKVFQPSGVMALERKDGTHPVPTRSRTRNDTHSVKASGQPFGVMVKGNP